MFRRSGFLSCLVVTLFLLASCGGEGQQATTQQTQEGDQPQVDVEQVTLKGASAFPKGLRESHGYETFVEILTTKYPEYFAVEYVGGPDTFSPDELIQSVRSGAVDIANLTGVYYGGVAPMAKAMVLPEMPPWEWRQNGIFDYFDKIHQRHNIKYMGRTYSGIPYHCYTQEPMDGPEDFEGRNIRTSPVYRPMLNHFGANTVTTPPGEVYTALDRGVVTGLCWPAAGIIDFGWHEKVNYRIDPGFFDVEVSFLMNLDTWKSLSPGHKERAMRAAEMMERQTYYWFQREAVQEKLRLQQAGVEIIEFTGDAKERYLNATQEQYWNMLENQANKEDVQELRNLLEKARK